MIANQVKYWYKHPECVLLSCAVSWLSCSNPLALFPSNTPSVLTIGRLIITARIAVIGRTLSQSGPAAEFKSFHSQTRLQQLGQRRYVLIRWLSGFQHTALWDRWILDSTKSAMMGLDHRHVLCLDLPCIRSTWQGITCGKKEPWRWLMGSGEGAL